MMSSQDKSGAGPFETLSEACAWLDSHINWEKRLDHVRTPDESFKLDPIRRLLGRLDHPHRHGLSIHIAGSRGKGSSALALEALLLASGLRVATFTSPHLYEYRERIRIGGEPLPPREFVTCLREVARANPLERGNAETFQTVFELLTATFFLAARRAGADILIVETGLGGRLDCTNVLEPGAVLLTRIGLEHTHILGDTHEAIAAEKAAILKPGGWGIANRQDEPGVIGVFDARSQQTGAPLLRAEERVPLLAAAYSPEGMQLHFAFGPETLNLELPLYGPFLTENLQGVLALYQELVRRKAIPGLPLAEIEQALTGLRLPGRMQPLTIAGAPDARMIVDGAHCPIGARAVASALEAHFGETPAIAVVGMMADKNHDAFFRALGSWPHWEKILVYQIDSIPRAASTERLIGAAGSHFSAVEGAPNLQTALHLALDQAASRAMIIALGSIFSVGPVMDWSCCHGRT